MITLAQILVKENEHRYKVNIPILQGRPDNINEVIEFNKRVKLYEIQGLNNFEARKRAQQNWKSTIQNPNFEISAFVCGLPNATNLYEIGDWVYVGFIDNSMSFPLILGHALGLHYKDGTPLECNAKPALNLTGLVVQQSAESGTPVVNLPSTTVFNWPIEDKIAGTYDPDNKITVEDIANMQKAINSFNGFNYTNSTGETEESTNTAEGINKLILLVQRLAGLLPLLNSVGGSVNLLNEPSKDTPTDKQEIE